MNYTFEHDFLMEKFMEEEPQTLDDMIPDSFSDWLERKQIDDFIKYAEEYGKKLIGEMKNKKVKTRCINCGDISQRNFKTDTSQCLICGGRVVSKKRKETK